MFNKIYIVPYPLSKMNTYEKKKVNAYVGYACLVKNFYLWSFQYII
jgi:hypothetical protein